MPGKKHLRGATKKEQRQYEHIRKSAQKSGRYGKRVKEVAAREARDDDEQHHLAALIGGKESHGATSPIGPKERSG